ncbi:hypothetical protein BGW36DRAFT_457694 [Talaromyces proteolyticus]|uniref:RING-type E3 ubiquitin transferase n=1 Tax=Talaromyces proteolyticus TaxID=1131652 RepID=A0AAD4Q4M5_9EURO|nr:uncharacterized protein BGW36DRAFT_457694 [Talaromyces proteolyticus]KAH8703416.1 hypothetical protein BGW36DRAFT_457694 [Talaromyces proteolyticus]
MAEDSHAQAPNSSAGPRNSNPGGGRRRGGGRGASHNSDRPDNRRHEGQSRGARGRGGGGRGRGGGDRWNRNNNNPKGHVPNTALEGGGGGGGTGLDGAGSSGDHPAGDAINTEGEGAEKVKQSITPATDEPDDGEVCFICASKVEHTSVAPCNHRTCHICALRLRALYKTKACAHCRSESPFVIFTDDPVKRFEDFQNSELSRTDDNLGIKYEKDEIFEDTVILLRYNCPDQDCDVACLGWPDLHRHVKSKHGKSMCDLCTRNKKVFTHEHELFTTSQLRKHEKYGDDTPGAIDQSGFKGHPECEFCHQRFYGDDELYAHCRDKHERCHICDRQPDNRRHQYYINYDALEDHFQKDHFLCLDKECLDKKFVVFETQMDLKGHQLESHPNGLSKDARRDARMVDMSTFDFRTPYQPQIRQRREGRGAGRGRDPNAEALPVSSAQPLRRDEIAYQRQMAIQSAQSVSTRSFGGQLTPRETPAARNVAGPTPAQAAAASGPAASSRGPAAPVAPMENLNLNSDSLASLSPQDQARRLRHTAVVERASNLLQNDASKISEFRTKVSNYRTSIISATELIDSFFSLFDTPSSELGKLIKELAEIYEDESKRNGLLKAWSDWRAINEDYPALPGPNGILPGMSSGTTGSGGKRVLRLKSSTAQSSRSAVGRAGSNAFPPLPASTSANSRSGTSSPAPAWSSSTPTSRPTVTTTSSFSRPPPRAQTGPLPRTNDREAFPSLPAAPKPNTLMAGLTRGTIRWDERRGPAPAAWGSNSGSGTSTPGEELDEFSVSGGGKRGKGKKGKQVLFQFG